ncbi:hypothetical protein [Salinimicrobium sp. GXAS 041]|uniref:hypothetical protein n=1 Tax=Salinimicrobium sp. GXAS 041 TaxID=3400806 RepID=UPI003C724315
MKSMFEKLQDYFNTTSREQIEKDWESTSKFDEVNGPSVEEFIECSSYFFELEKEKPDLNQESFVNNIKNPNFTSDFFLTSTYGKSKLFNREIYF